MSELRKASIKDLLQDNLNANRGTDRGNDLLDQSLQKMGAGRSVLIDKNNRLIAGNKTAAKFGELGLDDVVIVPTDGKTLIAVQRTDLDLDTPEGREMALADNRTGEVNLSWDVEALQSYADEGVDVGDWFNDAEMAQWDTDEEDSDGVDYAEMWQGMPEFEQPAQDFYKSIKVNFETADDLYQFSELIGQKITEKTVSINIPQCIPENLKNYECSSEP